MDIIQHEGASTVTNTKWSIHPAIVAAILINIAVLGLAVAWSGDKVRMFSLLHEDGIVEWMQFLCFSVTAAMLGYVAVERAMREPRLALATVGIAGVAVVVALAALEEISWFQRVLNVASPEFFVENNRQAEMNLHNLALGKASIHKTIMLKLILVIGLVHNIVLPILARTRPAIRRMVESLGLYLPPLSASLIYIALVVLSNVLIDHPRKGELGELFGATHYLSTAFAAYIIGAGYDSTPMVEHKADGRKITVMFIMVMLFLVLMAWMLTAVNRMAPV
jgi:hypothetical protein